MKSSQQNLFEQEAWSRGYSENSFKKPPASDQVRKWMEKYLPSGESKICLEVGCYPGGYLAVCGDHGYTLNGIDLYDRVETDMVAWLKSAGYPLGHVSKADFLAMDESKKYDLVYSHGFIEHFTNWQDILRKHANLVRPGGMLMVSAPNFNGVFQNWFHRLLDEENYDRHYVPSMDPWKWRNVLDQDFEIIACEYFQEFWFWIGKQDRSFFQKALFRLLRAALPILRYLPKNKKAYSPYCGIVARKRNSV